MQCELKFLTYLNHQKYVAEFFKSCLVYYPLGDI